MMQPIIESLEARALLSATVDNLIFPPPLPASAGAVRSGAGFNLKCETPRTYHGP